METVEITLSQWMYVMSQLPNPMRWLHERGPHTQLVLQVSKEKEMTISEYDADRVMRATGTSGNGPVYVLRFFVCRDGFSVTWSPAHKICIVPTDKNIR